MSLSIGIVGLPNVGKSTLFNALTQAGATVATYPFTTIEPNVGIVPVPDRRLTVLAELIDPELVTPATVEFVDIAGLVRGAHRGEGLGNQFLGHIRNVDAIALVCRCFESLDIAHVEGDTDPVRDLEILELELTLADVEAVERRLEKVRSSAKARPREYVAEMDMLQGLLAHLQGGRRAAEWVVAHGAAEAALVRELSLLTAKQRVYVANVSEEELPGGGDWAQDVARVAAGESAPSVVVCAQLEADLGDWPPEEAAEYRAEVGLTHSGLEALAQAGYDVLGLITFFTVAGGREVRAWSVERGTRAPQAAGQVHTQMEQGFIRAETLSFEALLEAGGWRQARERGLVRSEGRDYEIRDGDVCLFRFSP